VTKFNKTGTQPARGKGFIVTDRMPTTTTYEGGTGYFRDAKGELFLLAVSNLVGEATFYEAAGDRDKRYAALVREVAVTDPAWMVGFIGWLRSDGNMRSASLVAAVEATKAHLDAKVSQSYGTDPRSMSRRYIDAALQRADEPGELVAYWQANYGRALPKPVKRGIADAVRRLYNEYALLKYDTASHAVRFADVLDLCHPAPATPEQGALFKYALDRRHGRGGEITGLPMVDMQMYIRSESFRDLSVLLHPDKLKAAGMTWEDALSLAGNKVDKRKLWEALIPTMGYMALLRNLRNFDEAGVSDEVAATVATRLADPEQVAKSRQFPFRFLAAHRNVPSQRWGHALDKALTASLSNVPELAGRTLVLVDRSGSMYAPMSGKSELLMADAAAVFGAAIAMRNIGRVDLVQFGTGSRVVPHKAGDSLLKLVDRFGDMGGTQTRLAVQQHYKGHDRVLIVTDEQAWRGNGDPGSAMPADKPLYTWNLVGYRAGHNAGGPNRITVGGGLTDHAFRMVPLLEAGRNGTWPWLPANQ
jgi:hypothetical protein